MSQAEPSDVIPVVEEKTPSLTKRIRTWIWSNHQQINHFIQVLAIIAAGVWAFYTFIYTERIKPSNEPPTLATSATLETVGRKEIEDNGKKIPLVAIRATVTAHNTSKAKVAVMAAYFNVKGVKVKFYEHRDNQVYSEYVTGELTKSLKGNQDTEVARYDELQNLTVVHSNNLLQNWTMDPGDQYSRSTIFYLPENSYDLLNITFDIYLARDPRYIEVIDKKWECHSTGGISVRFFVKRQGRACDADNPASNCDSFDPYKVEYHKQLKDRYNLTHYDSNSALSLWETQTRDSKTD